MKQRKILPKTQLPGYDLRTMAKRPQGTRQSHFVELADVPTTNPHDIQAVYSNHFGVSATMTDFTLFFLEVGQTPGPSGPIQKQEVKSIVTLPMIAATGLMQ